MSKIKIKKLKIPNQFNADGYCINYPRRSGYSFGLGYPVQYCHDANIGWFVYVYATGELLAMNLQAWEVGAVAVRENEKRGYGCTPDIEAIDSTP